MPNDVSTVSKTSNLWLKRKADPAEPSIPRETSGCRLVRPSRGLGPRESFRYPTEDSRATASLMNIRITYATHANPEPVNIDVRPEDYFDPLDDPHDTYATAGVPRHLTPDRYTPHSPSDLRYLVVVESYSDGNDEVRIQYLDGLKSHLIHSISRDGTEELIHSTDISDTHCHVLRTQKLDGGLWTVVLNSILHHNNPADVIDYIGRYNWHDLREYWLPYVRRDGG